MSVKMRQEVERKIVGRLVADLLAAGYRLAVSYERGYDHDDMLVGSRTKSKIMAAIFDAADDCHIFIQPANGPTIVKGQVVSIGWVYCVFGNDGYDVISDYTTNLRKHMAGADKLAEKYA